MSKVKEPEVIEETPAPVVEIWQAPAIVPDPDGYYHDASWLRIECDWEGMQPREGFAPLWAEIDVSLTFREAWAISLEPGTPMRSLFPHIVNRVRAWNAREFDPETGTFTEVPPPSEIGVEAFYIVRPNVVQWLATMIKIINLGGGPKGGSATQPSGDGPSGPNAAG